MQKEFIFTKKGLGKIENELGELKTVRRREIADKIKQALAFGDISENSEYDEAKNEQAEVEIRILELENMSANARIVKDEDISLDYVGVGTLVKVIDLDFKKDDDFDMEEIVEYTIVGMMEADPYEFKISTESPIGKALLGCKKEEEVEITVPNGTIKYRILDIRKEA
ncbi:MAG: transcription elongation factor GreA [Peptostreptococcaceae bacterium]|nr:transcription elongation factor GreA [Peptostreptococcaceae bacterium]